VVLGSRLSVRMCYTDRQCCGFGQFLSGSWFLRLLYQFLLQKVIFDKKKLYFKNKLFVTG
jgi:hypothetical protein